VDAIDMYGVKRKPVLCEEVGWVKKPWKKEN